MLTAAYPTNPPPILNISTAYAAPPQGVNHSVTTLTEMAQFIKSITNQMVSISANNAGTIVCYDGTNPNGNAAIQLLFNDLIGQPKWVNVNTMQFTSFMRADMQIGSLVTMPKGLPNAPSSVTTAGASLPSSLKYQSAFQYPSQFTITGVRHIGNFRDPDGSSWATVFEAIPLTVT
jgi:hypothetical protein